MERVFEWSEVTFVKASEHMKCSCEYLQCDGSVIESVVFCPKKGLYGLDIPKKSDIMWNVWNLEVPSLNVRKVCSCRMKLKG